MKGQERLPRSVLPPGAGQTCHYNGSGYSVRASKAAREEGGYEYAAHGEPSPPDALGRVGRQVGRRPSETIAGGVTRRPSDAARHVQGPCRLDEHRGGLLVLDEKILTMATLTTVLRGHEGWAFELTVIDALD